MKTSIKVLWYNLKSNTRRYLNIKISHKNVSELCIQIHHPTNHISTGPQNTEMEKENTPSINKRIKQEITDTDTVIKQEITQTETEIKRAPAPSIDESQVQINVSNEELQKRIQNFIERKREQVNMNNIHDFIPNRENETDETCARVRAQYVKRGDSKGHLTVRRVNNEWGPQTIKTPVIQLDRQSDGLPFSISERVLAIEQFLSVAPVSRDVFRRLKVMEDRMACLQAVSPEYAHFWKNQETTPKQEKSDDYAFTADDIAKKIEDMEKSSL